jgi:hypothetical protein
MSVLKTQLFILQTAELGLAAELNLETALELLVAGVFRPN